MADRSVVVRLRADVANFTAQMRVAQQSVADFAGRSTEWAAKNKQSLDDVALKAGVAGAALTGLAVLAVSRFADFDQAMSSVQASTGETAANMELLRDAALEAGKQTVYSATESAGAIEELAKAGISTADILDGGLSGALNLAAAGGLAVADAAEVAATAMTQFGLSGKDVPRIADLLAQGANSAQGSVGDLAYALKQSGLVAAQFGLDVDETIGTLTAFASAGLLGSDAGTSFRTMLLRLANPSNEAKKTMSDLGVAAYDAQGNFVGMASLAEQLRQKMGPLSQAQRDAAFATIFGSDAIRAANVLYQEGGQGIQQWIGAVDQQGAAADTAAARLDNLKGDLEQLSGAFETALIGMGEGADGPLRSLVQRLTDAVNGFNELPAGAQGALLAIVGGGGLALLGVAGMMKLVTSIADTKQAFTDLGVTAERTKGILSGIAKGVVIAGVIYEGTRALGGFVDEWKRARGLILETDGLTRDLEIFGDTGKIVGQLDDLKFGVEQFGSAINIVARDGQFGPDISPTSWVYGFQSDVRAAKETVGNLDQALADLAQTNPEAAEAALLRIAEASGYTAEQVDGLVSQYLPKYGDELERTAATAGDAGKNVDEFGGILPEVTPSIEDQAEALKELNDQFFELANRFLDAREAERRLLDAMDELSRVTNDSESTQRDREAALDAVAEAQLRVLEGLYNEGAGIDAVNARLPAMRDQLYQAAVAAGYSEEAARQFADQVLASQGLSIVVPVSTPGMETAIPAANALRDAILRIPRQWSTTYTIYTPTGLANKLTYNMPSMYAAGGHVTGPGGPNDDTIPAWLSNGEYVLAASAVARLGVPFLDALNSGRTYGYAEGGYVGRRVTETVNRSETINVGQVVAHDYHDFRRQMDRERRLAALPGARR